MDYFNLHMVFLDKEKIQANSHPLNGCYPWKVSVLQQILAFTLVHVI